MLHIIAISAPSASGKDTVAAILQKHCPGPFFHTKFAAPLREAAKGFFGVDDATLEYMKRYDDTTRSFLIGLSQKVVKPIYGEDYFGLVAGDKVQVQWAKNNGNLTVALSDVGFQAELDAFVGRIKDFEPEARITLVRIVRPFCIFGAGDSREEVHLDPAVGAIRLVYNHGSLEDLEASVLSLNLF